MSTDGNTALALNDDFLREVAGMATAEDVADVKSLPVMKINYDGDSAHPQGSWVVGQKKKDDVITEEGQRVKGLVILAVRNRYAYYVEADTAKNCNSPLHLQGDQVRGSNYKHICGKGCPNRAEGLDPRCQAQKVVYGLALTEDDKLIECVAYLKGSGYMPLAEYVESATKVKMGSKFVTVPPYVFLTLLGSTKKKNGSVVYWVPEFTKGPAFSIEQVRGFDDKRKQVYAYIDSVNASIASETEGGRSSAPASSKTPYSPSVEPEIVSADEIPAGVKKASKASVEETPPWEEIAAAASGGEDEIEAAIAKAMAGLK